MVVRNWEAGNQDWNGWLRGVAGKVVGCALRSGNWAVVGVGGGLYCPDSRRPHSHALQTSANGRRMAGTEVVPLENGRSLGAASAPELPWEQAEAGLQHRSLYHSAVLPPARPATSRPFPWEYCPSNDPNKHPISGSASRTDSPVPRASKVTVMGSQRIKY